MKKTLFLFFLSVIPFFVQAQNKPDAPLTPKLDSTFIAIDSRNDNVPPEAYIDSAFFAQYGLQRMSVNPFRIIVWRNINPSDNDKFIRICDIRWRFNSHKEALDFHRKYLNTNAEDGREIKDYHFTIPGVKELKVFRESDAIADLVKKKSLAGTFYYYIFVVDNYAVKVFVNGKPDLTVDEASVFAKEAANRMNALVK